MPRPLQTVSILAALAAMGALAWLSAPGNSTTPSNMKSVALSKPAAPPAPAAAPITAASADKAPPKPIASDVGADAQIAAILSAELKGANLPAMAAIVVKDGRVVGSAAVGVRKMKDATAVTVSDPFHLANNTKAFTGVLIGRLVDEGKLRWDTTIAEALGREIPGIHPDFAGVTVDQLLHHRSGLLARGPTEVWGAAQRAKGPASQQRSSYVEAMLSAAPAKQAGQYQYSNAGYAVLGMIAEVAGGKPYEQLLQEQVLAPLGITTAGFGPAGDANKVDAPWPHLDGSPSFTDNPDAINSSARMHMSMADWAKFAIFELGHQPTPPLLKPDTFAHLQALQGEVKDTEMGYACGWFRPKRDWAGGRALHHVGSNVVTFSEIWLAPEKDFGVMVACNEGNPEAGEACDAAAAALIERFLGVAPGPLNSARDRSNPVKRGKAGN